jgi:hypothetical protein
MLPCVAPAARQYCLHAVMGWFETSQVAHSIYFQQFYYFTSRKD